MVVVARTFTSNPATVTASLLYLALAIVFGLLANKTPIPIAGLTVVFVPLLALSVWLGITYPLGIPQAGVLIPHTTILIPPETFWICILLVYIFIASVTPVWILLQPRDYLSSFLLYALIIGGFVGVCVAQPEIKLPAYRGFTAEKIGTLFPMLFVVVACGAISGFHSLVASGTSAKQLNRETDAVPVGYGAMLIEGALAVLALITALRLSYADYSALSGNPILLFSQGIGNFLSKLRLPMSIGVTFATLAVSAFALTTLDTATRLSRFSLQELLPRKVKDTPGVKRSWLDRYSSTLICVTAAGSLALSGEWKSLWPLFGSANQLLAALALLTVSVWLYHLKRNIWYTLLPTCFMFIVTLSALGCLFHSNFGTLEAIRAQIPGAAGPQLELLERQLTTKGILLGVTGLLFLVALFLLLLSIVTFKRMRAQRREKSGKRELPFLPRG
jgi:carbon starvation protein